MRYLLNWMKSFISNWTPRLIRAITRLEDGLAREENARMAWWTLGRPPMLSGSIPPIVEVSRGNLLIKQWHVQKLVDAPLASCQHVRTPGYFINPSGILPRIVPVIGCEKCDFCVVDLHLSELRRPHPFRV